MVSIATGSFEEDAMASPQLTIESMDSVADLEGSPATIATATAAAVIIDDDEEHDDAEQDQQPPIQDKPLQEQPRELGAPLSSISLRSVQSTDQILELNSRLDLSDSSAILSRLNHLTPEPPGSPPSCNYRRSSPSCKISVGSLRPRLSRRPSMHETHDSAPLRRGEFLYYLYSFAILGTTIRVFCGRLFGLDCEFPGAIKDFLTPLTENICVTSSGATIQHGGALFISLPANMLGSFIMGLVSSLHPEGGRYGSKLPWLRKEHPLQRHDGIHHAIKVGLCGSLTTFSSWNSQMVMMMDGTDTELGPQVVSALFGYMIGMACAAWAFILGGRVHEWLYDWSNGIKSDAVNKPPSAHSLHGDEEEQPATSWDSEDSSPPFRHSTSSDDEGSVEIKAEAFPRVPSRRLTSSSLSIKEILPRKTSITICMHKVIPFCISVSILLAYGLTVDEGNVQFFRELFASSLLTPIGVHLRWKLAPLNGRGIGSNHRYEWVPWGTLTGNLSAVVISVVFVALYMKYQSSDSVHHPYILALVVGMKTGVAGSLSTVSSFAKETVNLATIHQTHAKAYIYSAGTIISSMLLGLAIYSPMMRYS